MTDNWLRTTASPASLPHIDINVAARALLTSAPENVTSYIDADARDPATIIAEAGRRWPSASRSRS